MSVSNAVEDNVSRLQSYKTVVEDVFSPWNP